MSATWTFLTNHAHVLICLSSDADLRMRDLAVRIGITERAVSRIIHDLSEAGFLEITKEGRRNHYRVRHDMSMRHPVEAHVQIGSLLETVVANG